MLQRVYVCSPYRGDVENNIRRAKEAARLIALKGYFPVVPHIYLTQFLDDSKEDERNLGLSLGIDLLENCVALCQVGDHISSGMSAEIERAKQLNIPIVKLDVDGKGVSGTFQL